MAVWFLISFFGSFFFVLIPAGAACMLPSVAVLLPSVAGCRGVECVPAATLQGCGGLFLSPVGQLCLASHLAGLWGFPVALPAVSLNAHADGWRVSGMMSAASIGGRLSVLGHDVRC